MSQQSKAAGSPGSIAFAGRPFSGSRGREPGAWGRLPLQAPLAGSQSPGLIAFVKRPFLAPRSRLQRPVIPGAAPGAKDGDAARLPAAARGRGAARTARPERLERRLGPRPPPAAAPRPAPAPPRARPSPASRSPGMARAPRRCVSELSAERRRPRSRGARLRLRRRRRRGA
ncbi:hypothetical protein ACRRTK_018403 [Alexandromys fortis]